MTTDDHAFITKVKQCFLEQYLNPQKKRSLFYSCRKDKVSVLLSRHAIRRGRVQQIQVFLCP